MSNEQKQKVLKFSDKQLADLAKRDPEKEYKQIVYSEVYAPMRPDTDGMYMTAEDIENMAHNFLASGLTHSIDIQHDNVLVEAARVVESFIAREGDPIFNAGAWVVGIKVTDDALWKDIIEGRLNGFSVEAKVFFEENDVRLVADENQVVGHTSEEEGHSHRFVGYYDEHGTFLGGETDTVDGHFHIITSSTYTRRATGGSGTEHRHTFVSVDNLILQEV